MSLWWIENKKVVQPLLVFIFGLLLISPLLFLIKEFSSLTKLYNGSFKGSYFNFLLSGLIGIVFIISSIVQLIKIVKNK